MKTLLVGQENKYSLTSSYKRAFESLNYNVSVLDIREKYENHPLVNTFTHRFFWRILGSFVQDKLIKKVDKINPDIILIIKGWIIRPDTLKEIKKQHPNIALFHLNPDNPFNTWHHGNSNSWIRSSIPIYDSHFFWGKFLIEKLKSKRAKRVDYLPFGYDPDLHYPAKISNKEKEYYGSDIAFVGSWDEEREEWLSSLIDYDLKIWGNHWEKAPSELQEKWQGEPVYGEEFSKVCNASKINLNFIRKQNRPAHNMRTFEVPACSGFLLSERTKESKGFFEEEVEADYFSTKGELRNKIKYYLENSQERKNISKNGRKKVLNNNHSYKDRAKKILTVYKDIN
ncbi:MAG: glycosyltransferase [Candidatus Magasanikbacteria bacterium]